MTRRLPARAIGVTALVLVATIGVGRPSARPPQTKPSSEPLSVDFLAVASDGRPVRDLKPEDLTVRMDGKARTVRSLQLVPVGDAPGSGVKTGAVDIPPPFATNVASHTGRAIAIVIDDESLQIGDERPIRDAAAQLLTELPPTDRVAVFTVPHGGLKVDFTTDREKVRQALALIGGRSAPNMSDKDLACQTRTVLEQLTGTLNSLAGSGGPIPVIVLTTGLVGPRTDQISAGNTVGICELTPTHFQEVALAAADAQAQFYLVQPSNVLGSGSGTSTALFGGNTNPRVGMEHLAGVTGGQVLHLATGSENVLSRIARETSAYYQVVFDTDPSDRNSRTHRFEIKVARSDVTLRTRPTVTVAKADTKAAAKSPKDTLRDVSPYRDLPLRATGFSSRNVGGDKMKVVAVIDALDPAVTLTAAVAGLFDASGKLTAQWIAKPEDVTGRPVLGGMLAPPGTYRLRVAASDSAGHLGAVDTQLIVELTPAGSLKLSSLVLGAPRAGGGFSPRLEFTTEPTAIVLFELYGGKPNMQLGAAIEISDSLNGPALLQLSGADIKWSATAAEPDLFTATAQLPIASLKPGDYVVRAIVGIAGEQEGRVVRTLRKR
jgi:VWFA-related protein